MSTIDRIMIAYRSKHDLTPEMDALVRREIIRFMKDFECADTDALKIGKHRNDAQVID